MTDATPGARLRELICRDDGLHLPGAATFLGLPDHGFISLPEIAARVAAASDVVDIPLAVDADTRCYRVAR